MTDSPADRRSIDTAEVVLGAVLLVVWATSMAGMVLAEAGAFSLGPLLLLAALLSVSALGVARRALRASGASRATTPGRDWLTLLVVAVVAAWLFQPPADTVIEGSDASVYLAIGGMVASEGGLAYTDPAVDALPADLRDDLFHRSRLPPVRHDFFPGGIQLAPDGGVEPSFFHLVPVWVAAFSVVFGAGSAASPNLVFGVLAVVGVWALARRLASSFGAAVAAALLLANFAQVWFARLPTAEVATEAFVVATLLGLVIAADGGPLIAAALAGLALGLVGLTRVDGLVLVAAPLLVVGLYRWLVHRDDRRPWTWFLAAGCLGTAFAAFHAWVFAGAYTQRVLRIAALPEWGLAGGVTLMIGVGAAAVLVLLGLVRFGGRRGVRVALFVAGAAAAAWVLTTSGAGYGPFLVVARPVVAVLMLAGLVAALATRRSAVAWPVALVFVVSAFVYLQSPRDVGGMPMVLRRFVPVVLPLGAVFAGVALAWLAGRRRLRAVSVIVAVLLVAGSARQVPVLVTSPPNQGVRAAVSVVAEALPEASVTLVDPRAPSHLGLALRYHFDRLSLVPSGPRERRAVERAVRVLLDDGRDVRVIVSSAAVAPDRLTRPELGAVDVHPVDAVQLEFSALAPAADRLPDAVVPVRRAVEIYEVTTLPDGGRALPVLLDLGELDFGWVGTGFHGPESIEGAGVRWTNGEAGVLVPPLTVPDGWAPALRVRLSGPRPDGEHPTVVLEIDGEPLGSFEAGATMGEHRVEPTGSAAASLARGGVLTVRSDNFVPADYGTADGRQLGVLIDWLRIEAGAVAPIGR